MNLDKNTRVYYNEFEFQSFYLGLKEVGEIETINEGQIWFKSYV